MIFKDYSMEMAMKFTFRLKEKPLVHTLLYNKINVTLSLFKEYLKEAEYFNELKPNIYYSCEIKPVSEKKTLSQNSMVWELITAISRNKQPYIPPEEVYRELVQDFETYYVCTIPIRDEQKFINDWESRGIAWCCKIIDRDDRFVAIKCIYGSSVWSKEQLSKFIDILKNECLEQNIPIERDIYR